MRKCMILLILAAAVGAAWAQETDPEGEEARPEVVYRIKVLQNPYDIASFYRSSQGGSYFGYQPLPTGLGMQYPIAGYYRSHQGYYGYAAFWSGGYWGRRPGIATPYRRRIGENGDLFLFMPTFLAPVGPLAGAFFDK